MKKANNRNGIAVLLIITAIIIAGILWWKSSGRQTVKKEAMELAPKVLVSSLNITDINENSINIDAALKVENRVPFDIQVDSLDYELWVDSVKVMQTRYSKKIKLPKSDTASVVLPLELETKKLKSILKELERRNIDSATYTIRANFKMNVPIAGKRDFDVEMVRKAPAFRVLEIKPEKFEIENLGFKESDLDITLNVLNKNPFPVKMKDGKYTVKIEKDLELEGNMGKLIIIPPKSSEKVLMHMKLKTAKVPKLGWKLLFREKKTHFDIKYSFVVMSEAEMMKYSKMKIHAQGTIDELKDFAKE